MDRQSTLRRLIVVAFVMTLVLPIQITSAAWTSWSWYTGASGYPVSGGVMKGGSGVSWWDTTPLQWRIYGTVTVPTSLNVYVNVIGYDKCANTSWTTRMQVGQSASNTTGAATNIVVGDYANCQSGHQYRVFWNGQRQRYSGSTWEGTWTYIVL